MNILYLLKLFPALSETFILNEITRLIDLNQNISIISLYDMKENQIHNDVYKYNILKNTYYLKYFCHYSKNVGKEYDRKEILERSIKEIFENNILDRNQIYNIINFCYNKELGKENSLRRFLDIINIINIIKNKKINHIHCHFAKENVKIAYIINKILGIPYTFTTHAYDIFISPDKDIKLWADNAKKVIAVSEFNKRYMHKHFNISLDKIKIITYSKYLDKLTTVKDYSSEPFKIVSISRLVEKKGYPYLIKACKILKDNKVNFSCKIQGDGHQRQELEDLIHKLDLKDKVSLGTSLTHEEVIEFIKTGSVFVLPCIRASNNDMDGIPNVLMESMAMQIPTISTDVTGIPELIDNQKNGLIVPQKDPEALAKSIIRIKEDKNLRENLRQNSRQKVMEKFNVEKNVNKLLDVFKE